MWSAGSNGMMKLWAQQVDRRFDQRMDSNAISTSSHAPAVKPGGLSSPRDSKLLGWQVWEPVPRHLDDRMMLITGRIVN